MNLDCGVEYTYLGSKYFLKSVDPMFRPVSRGQGKPDIVGVFEYSGEVAKTVHPMCAAMANTQLKYVFLTHDGKNATFSFGNYPKYDLGGSSPAIAKTAVNGIPLPPCPNCNGEPMLRSETRGGLKSDSHWMECYRCHRRTVVRNSVIKAMRDWRDHDIYESPAEVETTETELPKIQKGAGSCSQMEQQAKAWVSIWEWCCKNGLAMGSSADMSGPQLIANWILGLKAAGESAPISPEVPQAPVKFYNETQDTITEWANTTFGPSDSNIRIAARANEEMAELLRALSADDDNPKAAEEIADVVIVLYRVASRLGYDLHELIDQKMEINRGREWKLDNTGHGYHVRGKSATPPATPSAAVGASEPGSECSLCSGDGGRPDPVCDQWYTCVRCEGTGHEPDPSPPAESPDTVASTADRLRKFSEQLESGESIKATRIERHDTPDGPMHVRTQTEIPPSESPDDWVTQDRVPARVALDEYRVSGSQSEPGVWKRCIYGTFPIVHGYQHGRPLITGTGNSTLELRCRRKDLPVVPAESPSLPSPWRPMTELPTCDWFWLAWRSGEMSVYSRLDDNLPWGAIAWTPVEQPIHPNAAPSDKPRMRQVTLREYNPLGNVFWSSNTKIDEVHATGRTCVTEVPE